jgi:hypothetical protein
MYKSYVYNGALATLLIYIAGTPSLTLKIRMYENNHGYKRPDHFIVLRCIVGRFLTDDPWNVELINREFRMMKFGWRLLFSSKFKSL